MIMTGSGADKVKAGLLITNTETFKPLGNTRTWRLCKKETEAGKERTEVIFLSWRQTLVSVTITTTLCVVPQTSQRVSISADALVAPLLSQVDLFCSECATLERNGPCFLESKQAACSASHAHSLQENPMRGARTFSSPNYLHCKYNAFFLSKRRRKKMLPGSISKERLSISMSSRLDAALQKSSSTHWTASVTL